MVKKREIGIGIGIGIPDGSETGVAAVMAVEGSRSVSVNCLVDGNTHGLGIPHHRVWRDPSSPFILIHRHSHRHFFLSFLHSLLFSFSSSQPNSIFHYFFIISNAFLSFPVPLQTLIAFLRFTLPCIFPQSTKIPLHGRQSGNFNINPSSF